MNAPAPGVHRAQLRGKAQVRALLAERDTAGVLQRALEGGRIHRTVRELTSLMFDRDDVIRWRAVVALGQVAGLMARGDLEVVRELIRRLLHLLVQDIS